MPKKLIIVDYELSRKVPAIASLHSSIPAVIEAGYEVEFWGDTLAEDLVPIVKQRKIITVQIPVIGMIFNWLIMNIMGCLLWIKERDQNTAFLTTGGHFIFADHAIFQFYNKEWFRIQNEGVERGNDPDWHKYFQLWGVIEEYCILALPFCKYLLPASDAIKDDMQKDFPNKHYTTLPNSVDKSVFNVEIREQRNALREGFGIAQDSFVLVFASQGHYTRKGYWLALKSLQAFREKNPHHNVQLLVLGGREKKLDEIKGHMDKTYPDWDEWVTLTGWTDQVQEYMALSDALFFPSYFEAFSLVEIEAAAMRLPLILTRHHGSEMIMKEGVNGYYCDFNVDSIVKVLEHLAENPLEIHETYLGKALSKEEWWKSLVDCLQTQESTL